jgi:hypothetical protein
MQSIGRQNNLGKIAGPVAGILLLLAAVFLATSLCSAASSPGIPRIFKPEDAKPGQSPVGQSGSDDENKGRSGQYKEPVDPQRHGYQIDIAIGDRPFTTYYFDPAIPKPYLFPIRSGQGAIVTRSFPMDVIGDDEANNFLRDGDRGYRTPFVVPEEV